MHRAIFVAAALLAAPPAWAEGPPRDLAFDIYRKGEQIGSHEIDFAAKDGAIEAAIDIRIEVKLLFVPVYSYEHRNRELWRDGRLLRIDSRTDDNGEALFVKGAASPEGLAVESTAGDYVAPADVISTSWWNIETVRRDELLNSQRGELMAVNIRAAGEETIETAVGPIPARRYVVAGDAQLELWYDRDDRLAKIRFAGSDGAPIEYRRRD